jgi:hypothetical protein
MSVKTQRKLMCQNMDANILVSLQLTEKQNVTRMNIKNKSIKFVYVGADHLYLKSSL